MAKRCAKCGHLNENDRLFCAMCGEPLDADLQLIKNLEKMSKQSSQTAQKKYDKQDEDDEVPMPISKEEKSHAGIWIAVGIVVVLVAVGAWWLFLR